ncbi:MAG: hypothetical protein A4E52_01820 [Pelotomaculum sp. PtaB.Bin013]|nr:MAG: hypothetical protein A4E52_01820 [Pelotomaculum sp. PtaB.Bin013]
MRYILSLHLQNFMSHKDSKFSLAEPGELTCLSGPSDSGKSAAIKAVELLFTGKWDQSYLRHGARFCQVSATYSDNHKLTYRRGKTGSPVYTITLPDGQQQTYEGFGRSGIPSEVTALTGVTPISFGSDYTFLLNVQRQDAGPFLGNSVSAPGRSRIIGALSGCDEIDLAARMLSNQLIKDRQTQKQLTENIEKLDAELTEYDYLDALQQTIREVEQLLSRVRRGAELRDKLTQLQGNLELNRINQNKTWMEIVDLEMPIDYISDILDTQDQQINLHDNLFQRFAKLANINTAISEQESILQSTSDVPEITLLLETLDSDTQCLEQFQKLHSGLELAQDGLEKAGRVIALTANTDEIRGIVDDMERDIAAMEKFEDILVKTIANRKAIKNVAAVLEVTVNVSVIAETMERTDKDSLTLGRLLPIKDRFIEIDRGLAENEATLQQTVGLREATKLYADNEKKLPLLAALADLKRRRGEVDLMMGDVVGMIEEYGGKVAEEQSKFVGLLKEMGVCELCGSEITDEGLGRVI